MNTHNWNTETRPISDLQHLLADGYEVEVDSPDGFVPVSAFVDKGMWDAYQLTSQTGLQVKCNGPHLFETPDGWQSAEQLSRVPSCEIYTKNGTEVCIVRSMCEQIPIVDIQVDHPNHRYYTNGVSSHNTNVGKSLFLCHVAASTIAQGKHVLYLTMEMAEERIAQRIDANLLDVTMDTLEQMPKAMYESSFEKLQQRQVFGKLIIKEYPTSGGNVGHFRVLLDELALKKHFVPDLLIVDYINICSSVRFKAGGQTNSYTYVKSIAEELRGLAVEYNLPCLTATQLNREGFDNSDPSLTNTSESFGLPHTADLMLALVTSEELERDSLLMVKQLKNRYADTSKYRRFTIRVDRSKMRLSSDPQQQYLSDPIPAAAAVKPDKLAFIPPGMSGTTRAPRKNVAPAVETSESTPKESKWKITF